MSKNSLENYLKENDTSVPYLNKFEFEPDSDQERTEEDDISKLYDPYKQVGDIPISERILLPEEEFNQIFKDAMEYLRTVDKLKYEDVKRGNVPIDDFNKNILFYLTRYKPQLNRDVDKRKMIERLDEAIDKYYVLQPLIDNPDTSDIKVCAPDDIRVRIKGKAYSSTAHFIDADDLFAFVWGVCLRNGVGFTQPTITFTDSHDKNYILRFTVTSPYICAVNHPYLHIRKVPKVKQTMADLIEAKMLNENIMAYLIYRAKYSRAIVFAGPPGSGKSTLLNAWIEYLPKTRETLVIQENDELFTNQPGFMFKHVTHGTNGLPPCTLQDLGTMALVEGCNEFIIGEVKGGETRAAMTLVNAGGYAALTVHSVNAEGTLPKLADLVKYGSDYSFEEARRMLATFDTIVYMEGFKVREILECHGYDDETHQYIYVPIYKHSDAEQQTGEVVEPVETPDGAVEVTEEMINTSEDS